MTNHTAWEPMIVGSQAVSLVIGLKLTKEDWQPMLIYAISFEFLALAIGWDQRVSHQPYFAENNVITATGYFQK